MIIVENAYYINSTGLIIKILIIDGENAFIRILEKNGFSSIRRYMSILHIEKKYTKLNPLEIIILDLE